MANKKTHIVLGFCPGCKEEVITRDTFDVHVEKWNSGRKTATVYTHRACNTRANHSKD